MKKIIAAVLSLLLLAFGNTVAANAGTSRLEFTVTKFKSFAGESCWLADTKEFVDLSAYLAGSADATFTVNCNGKGPFEVSGLQPDFVDEFHANTKIDLSRYRLGKVKGQVTWPAAYGEGCLSSDGKIHFLDDDQIEIETSSALTQTAAGVYEYQSYVVLSHYQTASLPGSACNLTRDFKMAKSLAANRFFKLDLKSNAAKLHVTTNLTSQQIATGCEVVTSTGQVLATPEDDIYIETESAYVTGTISASLRCDAYVSGETELKVPYEAYVGFPKNVTLDFDGPLVTISGKIDFSYAACKTGVLNFIPTTFSARDRTVSQIGSDGSFSILTVPGKFKFEITKDADTDPSLNLDQCLIDNNERYVSVNDSSFDLVSNVGKYVAQLSSDGATGCTMSQQGYLPTSTAQVTVTIKCANSWSTVKAVDLSLTRGSTQVVTVTAPSHKLITLTGFVNFPNTTYASSSLNQVSVDVHPAQGFNTEETLTGWQKLDAYGYQDQVNATITKVNANRYQYQLQVPEGAYVFEVAHQKVASTSCLPAQSHYSASAGKMQSYFAPNAAYSVADDGNSTQAGPDLNLQLGSLVTGTYAAFSNLYLKFTDALDQSVGIEPLATNNRGVFTTANLCLEAGDYHVKASKYGVYGEAATNFTATSGTRVTLNPMPVVDTSPYKPLSSLVTGRLIDGSDNPLSGVTVVAVCEDGAYSTSSSKADGTFVLSGLRDESVCRFIFVASGVSMYSNTDQYSFLGNASNFEDSIALRSLTYADLGDITIDYSGHASIIPDIFVEQHDRAMNSEWLHEYNNLLEAHSWITATLPILHADENGVVADVELAANSSLRKSPYYDVWIYTESDFETFDPDSHYTDKAAYIDGVLYWPDDMRVPAGNSFIVLSDNESENRYLITATRGLAIATQTIVSGISATATVGKNVTANVGNWEDDSGENTQTFTYRWFSCSSAKSAQAKTQPSGCSVIAGATGISYKPVKPTVASICWLK